MTIAAAFLSTEGVVFGADSTTTFTGAGPQRHFNHAQKIFQIGEGKSTLGLMTWGMASFDDLRYRTMIAEFAEWNCHQSTPSFRDLVERFAQYFWGIYRERFQPAMDAVRQLQMSMPHPVIQRQIEHIASNCSGGFCIGGHLIHDRTPKAIAINFDPRFDDPLIIDVPIGRIVFWGVPNFMMRLIDGIDPKLREQLLALPQLAGHTDAVLNLIQNHRIAPPTQMPIRDVLDYVYASVYSTIKAMKFSLLPPWCGGPVELAVVTTDRAFRWVKHKEFDVAFTESQSHARTNANTGAG